LQISEAVGSSDESAENVSAIFSEFPEQASPGEGDGQAAADRSSEHSRGSN
jgi:hypothetical protein